MPFGQFTGILDEEPFNLLCTVNINVISSKWLQVASWHQVVIPFDTGYVVVKFTLVILA